MKSQIIACLKKEVVPATGCTEPVAIALSAAHAASLLTADSQIKKIVVRVSTNILKNAINVGVPRTERVGLEVATALGVFGEAKQGLAILSQLSEDAVKSAHQLHDKQLIFLEKYVGDERIYIETTIFDQTHSYTAVLSKRHDLLTLKKIDDCIVFEQSIQSEQTSNDYTAIFDKKIIDILNTIDQMDSADIGFMMEGYHTNKVIAEYGLKNGVGLGLGKSLADYAGEDASPEQLIGFAMQMTAAASDARMSGVDLPVMTSNGSGNNGLTAVLPIVAADIIYQYDQDKVIKALAMSHMINSYIKHYIGRLSSICACGVASATGSAIGIGYLMDLPIDQLPHIIDTMIANLSGMICDGAKLGCALKLSTATAAAVQSVCLLKKGRYANSKNGIVGTTPEESVKNLAQLANRGMQQADEVITDILLEKNRV